MKRVISLWLPKFATDRLCKLRQDWLDSPLGLIQENSGRLFLHAVNDAAEQAGIRAGMTLADARAILPELKTSETDLPAETNALSRLADWCGRYTPWTAPDEEGSGTAFAGGGSIWLDVTGCAHLFGGEDALMRDILDRLDGLGFTAYAAIADTPGAAWAAVRHTRYKRRRWTAIRRGQAQDILASMPVAGLRLPPATVSGLQAVGLRRIGDLMPIPRAALADRFGSEVADRLDQAFGDRPEPVSPLAPASPWHARISFAEPVGRLEDIAGAVRDLARDLAAMLEGDGLGARRLTLSFYHPDGAVDRLRAGTSQASRNAGHLARLFTAKLDRLDAAFGIDAITLTANASEKLSPAQAALDRRSEKHESGVAELADRLSNRLGSENVVQLTLQESHIPERAISATPVTARPRPAPAAPWRSGSPPENRPLRRPRPLRLLPRPEEVEAVAPVPDDPPVMFRWRKQVFRIEHADGPERIASEWWNDGLGLLETEPEKEETDTPSGGTVQDNIRDYYRVEDRRGRRFWVYRDGIYSPGTRPNWYVHGVFG
ncbi:MAG: Y-family DNA polymerase [Alphaproteobacteria bacterium]